MNVEFSAHTKESELSCYVPSLGSLNRSVLAGRFSYGVSQVGCSILKINYKGRVVFSMPFVLSTGLGGDLSERFRTVSEVKYEWYRQYYWPRVGNYEKPYDFQYWFPSYLFDAYLAGELPKPKFVLTSIQPSAYISDTMALKDSLERNGLFSKDFRLIHKKLLSEEEEDFFRPLGLVRFLDFWGGLNTNLREAAFSNKNLKIGYHNNPIKDYNLSKVELFFLQLSIDIKFLLESLEEQLGELLAYGGERSNQISPVSFLKKEYIINLEEYLLDVDKVELYNAIERILLDLAYKELYPWLDYRNVEKLNGYSKEFLIQLFNGRFAFNRIHNFDKAYLDNLESKKDYLAFISALYGLFECSNGNILKSPLLLGRSVEEEELCSLIEKVFCDFRAEFFHTIRLKGFLRKLKIILSY